MRLSGPVQYWEWLLDMAKVAVYELGRGPTYNIDPHGRGGDSSDVRATIAAYWALQEAYEGAVEKRGHLYLELPEGAELCHAIATAFLRALPARACSTRVRPKKDPYSLWLHRMAKQVFQAEARQPDIAPERLRPLAKIFPEEVSQNPMTDLVSLERPDVFESIQQNAERGQALLERRKQAAKRAADRRYLKKFNLD